MVGGASLLPSPCVHLWSEGKAKARRRQSEEMGEVFCYSFTEKGNNQGATFEKKSGTKTGPDDNNNNNRDAYSISPSQEV